MSRGSRDARDMSLHQWFVSNVEYARKLATSGLEGAGRGREEFLQGEPVSPFLTEAARLAVAPAVVGACLGWRRISPAAASKTRALCGMSAGSSGTPSTTHNCQRCNENRRPSM